MKDKSVNAQWAYENVDKINLIDVRTPIEFQNDGIKGSKNVPLVGLVHNHQEYLEKDKTYYFICHAGNRSYTAYKEMQTLGYDSVYVEGGVSTIKRK